MNNLRQQKYILLPEKLKYMFIHFFFQYFFV